MKNILSEENKRIYIIPMGLCWLISVLVISVFLWFKSAVLQHSQPSRIIGIAEVVLTLILGSVALPTLFSIVKRYEKIRGISIRKWVKSCLKLLVVAYALCWLRVIYEVGKHLF